MSLVCTRMPSICHHMYSYVIRMSLVCTHPHVARMSSVYHSYVIVCYLYVTRMHLHVILMSLVCPYITRLYSHVIHMSLVCGFTINFSRVLQMAFVDNVAKTKKTIRKKWFHLLNYNNRKITKKLIVEIVLPVLRFPCLPNIPFCFEMIL